MQNYYWDSEKNIYWLYILSDIYWLYHSTATRAIYSTL